MYILIIITAIMTLGSSSDPKLTIIEGFSTLQSCQKAEFKTKDQDGILTAFCIEKGVTL